MVSMLDRAGKIYFYSAIHFEVTKDEVETVARNFSIVGLYDCSGGLYILKFDENYTDL